MSPAVAPVDLLVMTLPPLRALPRYVPAPFLQR
jgi:hypothetical protein